MKRAWVAAGGGRYLAKATRTVFSTRRGLEKADGWVRPEKAAAVHWPVQVSQPNVAATPREALRERLGIPDNSPILLFAGRLHAVKRPIHVATAFCQAATEQAHLLMAGREDDVTAAAVLQALPHGKRNRVHLVGGLASDELAEAYRAADGFISLSFQENFGYAAAEAIANGLPVILSPGHDLAYDLPRTEVSGLACGWLLPDDTVAAATEAIGEWARFATSSSATLADMGTAGRTWAAETLSLQRFREGLQALL